MLDFRMETFLCVCKNMNYTKAADELGLTQPAVSQHIKYLEQYFKAPLFSYTNRKLSLTLQGEYLKHSLETLQHDTQRISDNIRNLKENEHIYIGSTLSIGNFYLPDKLAFFLSSNPDKNVFVTIADTAVLLQKLDEGSIDFALCEGYFNKNEYDWSFIRKERICGFISADCPEEKYSSIEDLFDKRLLIRELGSGTREVFDRYLHEHGYSSSRFPSQCEINSPNLILHMLLAGQGISFMYECVGKSFIDTGKLRELKIPDFNLTHEFNIIWKKNSIFADMYNELISSFL